MLIKRLLSAVFASLLLLGAVACDAGEEGGGEGLIEGEGIEGEGGEGEGDD